MKNTIAADSRWRAKQVEITFDDDGRAFADSHRITKHVHRVVLNEKNNYERVMTMVEKNLVV